MRVPVPFVAVGFNHDVSPFYFPIAIQLHENPDATSLRNPYISKLFFVVFVATVNTFPTPVLCGFAKTLGISVNPYSEISTVTFLPVPTASGVIPTIPLAIFKFPWCHTDFPPTASELLKLPLIAYM